MEKPESNPAAETARSVNVWGGTVGAIGDYATVVMPRRSLNWPVVAGSPPAVASAFHLQGCESYPGIFAPFGGFADGDDVQDGYVGLPDAPGIGLERKASLAPVLAALRS